MFSAEALTVLQARYLRAGETPEEMLRRVAAHVARGEALYRGDVAAAAEAYYRLMAEQVFLPNSPTLINAGKARAQLAACFVLPVEDSITGIFETLKHAALIHQSGGGTGFSFSPLRPRGDRVSTTGGTSSGPVSFLHIYDMATEVVKQGAVRRGANMAVLRVDHPDIEEFITAKQQPDALNNFNLSVGITDRFMAAAAQDAAFDLVNPRDGRAVRTVRAKTLFALLVRMAWQSGEPGLFFLDTVNRFNPTPPLGAFQAPNPCSEQPLLPYESCVLGSLNISRLLAADRRGLDEERLQAAVTTAVRFLDNVIDINDYPLPEVAEATGLTRKIGLGIMGLADVFIKLDIPYASRQATELTRQFLTSVTHCARRVSAELGEKRGSFAAFGQSVYPGQGYSAMRNATVTTVAPTGTISILAGCSSGIEPLFGLTLSRRVLDGQMLPSMNRTAAEYLAERNLLSPAVEAAVSDRGSVADTDLPSNVKAVLATAHEIAPEWHVAHLAAAQQNIDNGVAKTVNLPRTATEAEVAAVFWQAYQSGCKGITVYRDASRQDQVLTGGISCEDCRV